MGRARPPSAAARSLEGLAAERLGVDPDRGQRRVEDAGEGEVVEADDRQVVAGSAARARGRRGRRRRPAGRRRSRSPSAAPARRAARAPGPPPRRTGTAPARTGRARGPPRRARAAACRAGSRKVSASSSEPRWPIRVWPSSSRCRSASSVPRSVSKRTNDMPGGDTSSVDDVLAGRLGRVDGEEEEAVDRPGAQGLEGGQLAVGVVGDVDQRDRVAGAPGRDLGAAQHRPEERVRHVGDHQADGPRGPRAQRAGGDVGPVAELVGGLAHGRLRARRDASRRLAGQHQRHGRLRHAGPARHVDARDS